MSTNTNISKQDQADFIDWLQATIKSSNYKYKKVTCPKLVDNRCSDYENRPNCCRNHPQDNGYCAESDCLIQNIEKNTEDSSKLCAECGSKCCKRILIPINQEISEDFIMKWLSIDCDNCKIFFSKTLNDNHQV